MRCNQIVGEVFNSWNNPESSRRLNRIKLIIDVPDDNEPHQQSRSDIMKRKKLDDPKTYSGNSMKPKNPKVNSIKCANRCGKQFLMMIPCNSMLFYVAISMKNRSGWMKKTLAEDGHVISVALH